MPRKFSESNALRIAREHLERRSLPWERVEKVFIHKPWWGLFGADAYVFDFIGEAGWAEVWVDYPDKIRYSTFYPVDGRFQVAPLWTQFPEFSSVTISWRMAPGEDYHRHWHWWFHRLSSEERLAYQKLYPAPTDEERCWSDFYDLLAAK
jgi:hypothetical protein